MKAFLTLTIWSLAILGAAILDRFGLKTIPAESDPYPYPCEL